jgi:L-aspartate oxidase
VHGANRLASNSLLEAAVFGARAGRAAAAASGVRSAYPATAGAGLPAPALAQLRARMSAEAGVVRDAAGLASLLAWLDSQEQRFGQAAPLIAARLVAQAALNRRESRGAHFRSDHPQLATKAEHSRQRLAGAVQARAA